MTKPFLIVGVAVLAGLLAGCNRNPLLVKRSLCPAVAVPAFAGSLTRFDPGDSRDAQAISLTAELTDVLGQCVEGTGTISSDVSFKVLARRANADKAEDIHLPLFVALVQGGDVLVSKQASGVVLHFAAGQARAEAAGGARAEVARSAATVPAEVQERLSARRRPNRQESLIDPMADPKVRAAMRASSFEVLVGFQLDDPSLAYNIGK